MPGQPEHMRRGAETPSGADDGGPSDLEHARVLDALGHAVVVVANRDDMPVVYVNAAFEDISGHRREDMLGRNCRMLQGSAPNDAARSRFRQALAGQIAATVLVRNQRPDGELYWNEVALSPLWTAGVLTHFVGVQSDVTQRVEAQALVRKLADRDALTGLSNRRHLQQLLQADDELSGGVAGVLFIDVDSFKQINDALGHSVGDELLCELARRLAVVTRPTDVLARVGGDEFVVALRPGREAHAVQLIAQRVLEAVRRPFVLDGVLRSVKVSIGAADGSSPDGDLLRSADAAMYRVKRAGGDGWLAATGGA